MDDKVVSSVLLGFSFGLMYSRIFAEVVMRKPNLLICDICNYGHKLAALRRRLKRIIF